MLLGGDYLMNTFMYHPTNSKLTNGDDKVLNWRVARINEE